MIEKLVLSIVTFSLISTMIGNLTTDNVYKKYISGFAGILFVIMIINPVLSLLDENGMEKIYDKWSFIFQGDDYKMDNLGWEEEYIKASRKEYGKIVENKIGELIGDLCEVKKCEISFEENVESSNYGKIYEVRLEVGIKDKTENNSKDGYKDKDKIADVEKVSVGAVSKNKNESKGYKEMMDEIRQRIADYFEMEKEQIIIDYL